MENTFENLLSQVEVLEPVSANGFQVFGLRRPGVGRLSYLTLDEALQNDLVDVTEIDEGGSVPTLKVSNKADRLLFLMSGEQLQGAKQNRVLNISIMVASNSDLPIPVSCVEAGRWRYQSRKFASSGTASHSYLRAMMVTHVTQSYRTAGSPTSQQDAVWREVARKLGKMGSRSSSSALNQVYEDYESRLNSIVDLKVPAGSSGAVFAFDGRVAGMDLFDQSVTFEKLWPKLVRSYAIDSFETSEQPSNLTRDAVVAWLNTVWSAKCEKFRSPGIGDDVRFEGENLVGSSLLVDDEPIHTGLFSASPDSQAAS
jgi:hypothetical protein